MATIVVSGLPESCKLPKIVYLFKSLLKKEGIMKFWIKEMADVRGTRLKCAWIEFYSADQAHRAVRILDGFAYNAGDFKFPLSARFDENERDQSRRRSPSPYDYRARDRYDERHHYDRYDGYSRDRSRSPIGYETSKLDLEIELLRKQRMIIEEERRILLERKKLELVKEFGPSAIKEFKSLEDARDRRYRPERSQDYRPRRSPPPPRPKPSGRPVGKMPQLPQFFLPCKLLIGEMKDIMAKLSTKEEHSLLTKFIRSTIRKRLAVALEGKPIMPGAKIVILYREKYPASKDEQLVLKHLKELRACHLPGKSTESRPDHSNEGKEDVEDKNRGHTEKLDTDAAQTVSHNLKTEPCEPNPGWVKEDTSTENQEQYINKHAEYAGSLDSSEALALHDKNDEDWVEGVNEWDNSNAQMPK